MELKNKVIVNVSVGDQDSWYHRGQQRLYDSIIELHENEYDLLFLKKLKSDYSNAYEDKMMLIHTAWMAGYREILYLDCSITVIRELYPIWDIIKNEGHYLYKSGMNCAQTANDQCLLNFGITRDIAETYYEAATNVIGINGYHSHGQKLAQQMEQRVNDGSVKGIKWPNEDQRKHESKDPRFLFHRQDQTVISLIAGQNNMKIFDNEYLWRDENYNEPTYQTIFRLKGGY